MTVAGGDLQYLVGTNGAGQSSPDWSPGGLIDDENGLATSFLGSLPTQLRGGEPSLSPDGHQVALLGPLGGHELGVTSLDNRHAQQITYDGDLHHHPSWGPTASTQPAQPGSGVAVGQQVQAGGETVKILLSCPAAAGTHGCLDRLVLIVLGHKSGARTYRVGAGATKLVRQRVSHGLLPYLRFGNRLQLVLHSTVHGRTTTARQTDWVLLPAAIHGQCPAATVTSGSSVTMAGTLTASPTHAHAAAAGPTAGAMLALVATSPSGTSEIVVGHAHARGRYSVAFTPGESGRWTAQVVWNGDRKHPAAASTACGVTVSVPAPQPTTLTTVCPSSATAGSPATLVGKLLPAVQNEPVTITYTHAGQTTTDAVRTDANGAFTAQVTPGGAGAWQAQASYGGSTTDAPATSQTCDFTVAAIPTTVALSCPSNSSLGKPIDVSGSLSPGFAGPITLTYTHQTQGPLQTFRSSVNSDGGGSFSDSSITPTAAGEWDVFASYAGDGAHAPASSKTCTIEVS